MIREDFPDHGDIICLWYATYGKKYTRNMIARIFNSDIPKDQYEMEDKKSIIDYITHASNEDKPPYRIIRKPQSEDIILVG